MKKLIVLILALLVIQKLSAQSSFTESTFNGMMADYAQNPASWLKTNTAPGFTFSDNAGIVKNTEQTMALYKVLRELERTFSEVKISNNGPVAIVTAKLEQEIEILGSGNKMKSKLAITYTFLNLKNKWMATSAQHTPIVANNAFKIENWNDFNSKWEKNQLETIKENSDPKLTFINGNGELKTLNDLISFYTYYQENPRKYSNLNLNQTGQTAVVTGNIHQEWYLKTEPQKLAPYDGSFTYTFAHDGGKWVLLACQHTDRKH